jgi:hypothetical protein
MYLEKFTLAGKTAVVTGAGRELASPASRHWPKQAQRS